MQIKRFFMVAWIVIAMASTCAHAAQLSADEALLDAVKAGNGKAAAAAVFAGATINPQLLTLAASKGNADVVMQLLRLASHDDVDASISAGLTAASTAGHTSVVKVFETYLARQRAMRVKAMTAPAAATRLAAGTDLFTATRQAADGATFVLEAGQYTGPIYVKGKQLTLLGDPGGKTTIVGSEQMKSAVVVADANATLTLTNVGFKTSNDKQVAVLIRESKAVLAGCRFEGLQAYAVYCQAGDVVVSQCRFTQLQSPGVVGFKGAKVRVWQSEFADMKTTGLQVQDGSTLVVDDCTFGKVADSAIVGAASDELRVTNSRFAIVGKMGVSVQKSTFVLLANNSFSGCRRAANIDGAAELIAQNNTVKDSPDGDGFFIRPTGSTVVRGNHFNAIQTAVNINGQSTTATSLVDNTAVAMTRGGIYVSKGNATIQNNRILSFAKVGILLDSQTRATLTGNVVIADAGDAMAVSIQNSSSSELAGNTLVGDVAAINFYKANAGDTSIHGDVLIGAVLSGAQQPDFDDMSLRLNTLPGDEARLTSLKDAVAKWRGVDTAKREAALADVMAQVTQLRALTATLVGVQLTAEDAAGQRKAVGTRLYAAADVDFANVIAQAQAGQPAIVKAGKYWVADAQDSGVRRLITLVAGQDQQVTIHVERGLWLRFVTAKKATQKTGQADDNATEQWLLVRLREPAALRRVLGMLRVDGLNTQHDVMLRPEATAAQISAARDAALAVLPELIHKAKDVSNLSNAQAGAFWQERSAKMWWAFRILNVVGQPADIDTLARLCLENDEVGTWRMVAPIAARIDARSGPLATGRLHKWLASDNKTQALAAAMALYELGDRSGVALMRQAMLAQDELWMAYKPAFLLLDDDDTQTLDAMRKLHALCLADGQEKQNSQYGGANVAAALYLMAYGNADDWKQVTSVLMGKEHASYLLMTAQDPQALARYMVDHSRGMEIFRDAANRFMDRSSGDAMVYRELINQMVAMNAMGVEQYEVYRRQKYARSMNAAHMVQTFDRPWETAVGFLGGFERNQPIVVDAKAYEQTAQYLKWMIQPEYLDAYVAQWRAGRLSFAFELDHIALTEIEAAMGKGDGVAPGWELFKLYRLVGTQQYLEPYRNMSDGASHFPYMVKYWETNAAGKKEWGGGLSGVADVRADWRDYGLRIAVRLRQESFYNEIGSLGGMIGRNGNKARWPHHQYMLNQGRALIDHVAVRRGEKRIEAKDTGVVEDGWMIFKADMQSDAMVDLWMDVHLQFMDQPLLLTQSLSFGDQARRMRTSRDIADQWAAYAKRDASQTQRLMRWAHAECAAGRLARAGQAYRMALKHTPHDERAWADAAGALAKHDDVAQAIALLNEGVKANPTSSYLAGEIARAHYRTGAYEAAATAAAGAMKLSPDDSGLQFTRATCLLLMGKHDEAEALYAMLNVDFAPAYVAMLRYVAARSSEAILDEAATARVRAIGEGDESWRRTFDVLVGKMSLDAAMQEAKDNTEVCRLRTASGYQQLFAGRHDGAREQFALAYGMQRRDLLEWRLAAAGLERLKKGEETR